MVRLGNENILVVGDRDRRMHTSVANAMPAASVTSVQSVFDALAELNAGVYSGVLVNIDPIESRPEAATRALREAASEARLVVYSEPAHEPLSRTLVDHGADDYVIAPPDAKELQQLLSRPAPRVVESDDAQDAESISATDVLQPLLDLPMTDIVLSSMLEHPQQAIKFAVQAIAERVAPAIGISVQPSEDPVPASTEQSAVITHPIRDGDGMSIATLVMEIARLRSPTTSPASSTHAISNTSSPASSKRPRQSGSRSRSSSSTSTTSKSTTTPTATASATRFSSRPRRS
jgi:ActR/RegA family two-component response regulator